MSEKRPRSAIAGEDDECYVRRNELLGRDVAQIRIGRCFLVSQNVLNEIRRAKIPYIDTIKINVVD